MRFGGLARQPLHSASEPGCLGRLRHPCILAGRRETARIQGRDRNWHRGAVELAVDKVRPRALLVAIG